jgi:uncharacterized protein (DUF2237 family)
MAARDFERSRSDDQMGGQAIRASLRRPLATIQLSGQDDDMTRYDPSARNVLGGELIPCSLDPVTGFFRNGCCETGPQDLGLHTVCAVMTEEFLRYSASRGNDLSTPRPEYAFAGLKPGDRWCLCAPRWKEALDDGCAPQLVLESTHEETLAIVPLGVLKDHAVPA